MAKYYTNVLCQGNYILYRGVNNGKKVKNRVTYSPSLFVKSKDRKQEYKGIHGEPLDALRFESIRAAKEFQRKYKDVDNFDIYGMDRFEYAYMADNFKGQIEWNIDDINISVIDIEVSSAYGFPDPYEAKAPITAICIRQLNGQSVVFGCRDYDSPENVVYVKCANENDLCKKFIKYWEGDYPDVISGWNTDFFDIPYLVNRFRTLFGDDFAKKLSPWNNIWERKVVLNGRELISYHLSGINALDYIELYKWYAPGGKSQESYKLDAIANVELGERKLSYDEYDSLHNLYQENYQKFIDYNIKDVDLIIKLEGKLKLIELALTLAYDTKTNFEDVFAQTRMWDSLIYNHLLPKKIIVPPKKFKRKVSAFEGAYVKDPQVGLHKWVMSFDLNSLYPHLIMQYNISPDTLIDGSIRDISIEDVVDKNVTTPKDKVLAANGQYFRKDKKGFLTEMMQSMYEDRVIYKKKMIQAQKDLQKTKSKELEKDISKYSNMQLAKKVQLNSAYGALGNQYFRFYDIRQALAITKSGQLSIKWIEARINEYLNKLLNTDNKDYVITSDTDSLYITFEKMIDKFKPNNPIEFLDKVAQTKIEPFIDKSYQELADIMNAYDQKMFMKRETIADKAIWTAKKRYMLNVYDNEGVRYTEPKLKMMGIEAIKSSTPQACRNSIKKAINLIMSEEEKTVQDYIASFKKEFFNLPFEEVAFPRGVSELNKYDSGERDKLQLVKSTPIHVRGALVFNHLVRQNKLEKK